VTPGLAVLGQPAVVVAEAALAALGARLLDSLAAYHRDEPLRASMPREALRERVGPAAAAAFERALSDLSSAGRIAARGDGVSLVGHAVRLDAGEEAARRRLVEAANAAGLAGIEVRALEAAAAEAAALERVARVLVAEKVLARVGERGLVTRASLDALVLALRERFARGARLEVGALKELTGLTRKHAIPLLEYLDRERVTRRAGADRILL
jgi:selenocysteine-specific elongation factor